MSPALRRSGLVLLLAVVVTACEVDSFGYTPTCGPADPPEACRKSPDWNDYAHVFLTLESTGIDSVHTSFSYGFIGLASDGDTVLRKLIGVGVDSTDLWVPGGKLRLKYLGLRDAEWNTPRGPACTTAEPIRDLSPRVARVVRATYSLVCMSQD